MRGQVASRRTLDLALDSVERRRLVVLLGHGDERRGGALVF
jgi:hypothetical protein